MADGQTDEAQTLRQVALASYGSLFLRGKLDLEAWYRHAIFWDARFAFRDRAGRRLLAADFTQWLGSLRAQGALRLSLHPAAALPDPASVDVEWGTRMLIVHFPGRWQCWAAGTERARDAGDYPDASYYAGALDAYWLLGEVGAAPPLPQTDWRALAETIQADLDLERHPLGLGPTAPAYAPYVVAGRADLPAWARLPLIPDSPQLPLPHCLLAVLGAQRGRYSNDMNPKNENSAYHASAQVADEMDDWVARCDSWYAEVQLRAANELRWGGATGGDATLERLHDAPVPAAPAAAPAPTSAPVEPAPLAGKPSAWSATAGMFVASLVLTALVLACAHIIAGLPWLALPIWALAMIFIKYRKN
ncbi:hypothetical protein AAKU55_002301 [Oxalobacteraceae bacterium GrIS 1.11]